MGRMRLGEIRAIIEREVYNELDIPGRDRLGDQTTLESKKPSRYRLHLKTTSPRCSAFFSAYYPRRYERINTTELKLRNAIKESLDSICPTKDTVFNYLLLSLEAYAAVEKKRPACCFTTNT
jgi:hypothetical protein